MTNTLNTRILESLKEIDIPYQLFEHPAVFTVEEANKLCPEMPAPSNKNLFLRDKKKNFYLFCLAAERDIKIKTLQELANTKALSFAQDHYLMEVLQVKPGSVGLLALLADTKQKTEVFIDTHLLEAEFFESHPGINTQTVCFSTKDIPHWLALTGHHFAPLDLTPNT